jgi:hypothetical protein
MNTVSDLDTAGEPFTTSRLAARLALVCSLAALPFCLAPVVAAIQPLSGAAGGVAFMLPLLLPIGGLLALCGFAGGLVSLARRRREQPWPSAIWALVLGGVAFACLFLGTVEFMVHIIPAQ